MADELNKVRLSQINEKVKAAEGANAAQYDIIYPETRADVVKETFGPFADKWNSNVTYKPGQHVWVEATNGTITSYEAVEQVNPANINTNKDPVIETGYWKKILSRRFVTPADVKNWDGGGSALRYVGAIYANLSNHKKNDVVVANGFLWICLKDSPSAGPLNPETNGTASLANEQWMPLSEWAQKTNYVNIRKPEGIASNTVQLLFSSENGTTYGQGAVYRGSTDASATGIAKGIAYEIDKQLFTEAGVKKYAKYFTRNADKTITDNTNPAMSDISAEFKAIYELIRNIETGGSSDFQLPGSLTIKIGSDTLVNAWKGATDVSADFTSAVESIADSRITANIKTLTLKDDTTDVNWTDTYDPKAATDKTIDLTGKYAHLDSNKKILVSELPDTVFGSMEYIGTFDASNGTLTTSLGRAFRKGDYAIAIVNGNQDPSKVDHPVEDLDATDTTNENEAFYFMVGDWAAYNGTTWDKIDNTDAVRTVNGQIGNVQTYKGTYAAGTQYHAGDWVKKDNYLYLCVVSNNDTEFTDSHWILTGKSYTADETWLTIDANNKILHKELDSSRDATTSITKYASTVKLVPNQSATFLISPKIDKAGHVVDGTFVEYETVWRPIKVSGIEVLADDSVDALEFVAGTDNIITPAWDATAKAISFNLPKVSYTNTESTVTAAVESDKGTIKLSALTNHNDYGIINGATNFTIENVAIQNGDQTLSGVKTLKNTTGNGSVVLPETTGVYDLGSADLKFRKIYTTEGLVGTADAASKWATAREFTIKVKSGSKLLPDLDPEAPGNVISGQATVSIDGTSDATWVITLGNSGVASGVYTAVKVNEQGIVTAGGQVVEFGTVVDADPTASLVVGGVFFRRVNAPVVA